MPERVGYDFEPEVVRAGDREPSGFVIGSIDNALESPALNAPLAGDDEKKADQLEFVIRRSGNLSDGLNQLDALYREGIVKRDVYLQVYNSIVSDIPDDRPIPTSILKALGGGIEPSGEPIEGRPVDVTGALATGASTAGKLLSLGGQGSRVLQTAGEELLGTEPSGQTAKRFRQLIGAGEEEWGTVPPYAETEGGGFSVGGLARDVLTDPLLVLGGGAAALSKSASPIFQKAAKYLGDAEIALGKVLPDAILSRNVLDPLMSRAGGYSYRLGTDSPETAEALQRYGLGGSERRAKERASEIVDDLEMRRAELSDRGDALGAPVDQEALGAGQRDILTDEIVRGEVRAEAMLPRQNRHLRLSPEDVSSINAQMKILDTRFQTQETALNSLKNALKAMPAFKKLTGERLKLLGKNVDFEKLNLQEQKAIYRELLKNYKEARRSIKGRIAKLGPMAKTQNTVEYRKEMENLANLTRMHTPQFKSSIKGVTEARGAVSKAKGEKVSLEKGAKLNPDKKTRDILQEMDGVFAKMAKIEQERAVLRVKLGSTGIGQVSNASAGITLRDMDSRINELIDDVSGIDISRKDLYKKKNLDLHLRQYKKAINRISFSNLKGDEDMFKEALARTFFLFSQTGREMTNRSMRGILRQLSKSIRMGDIKPGTVYANMVNDYIALKNFKEGGIHRNLLRGGVHGGVGSLHFYTPTGGWLFGGLTGLGNVLTNSAEADIFARLLSLNIARQFIIKKDIDKEKE